MNAITEFLRAQLDNEVATGGALAIAFGAVLASLRSVPGHLWRWMKRRFVVEIDIADHDLAFFWLQAWLARHPYARRARLLTVSTRVAPGAANRVGAEERAEAPEVSFSPAPGPHLLWHKGRPVLLWRYRWKPEGGYADVGYREELTLFTLSRATARSIVNEARQQANAANDGMLTVYRSHFDLWIRAARRDRRPIGSVVLDDGAADDLLADLRRFEASREQYVQWGIPYQRGYLLHGPPGSGKSSIVAALAGALGRDLFVANPATSSENHFAALIAKVPANGILLIEDVDGVFDGRKRADPGGFMPLTFSGFINAIDGVAAPPGRVLFMTTNHPESLDEALMRPGRVDVLRELGPASASQAWRLFDRFFPGSEEHADRFARRVATAGWAVSMAELQEWLVAHRLGGERLADAANFEPDGMREAV